ncbi:hypothetical protein B9P87_06950 [Staphylococcus aureus]|nr:hypothetical protein B9P87_06950 [Staphylococcus aureus]
MKICEKCFNNTEIVEIIANDNSKIDNCDIDNNHLGVKIFDTTKDKDKLELIRDYLRPALELYDISINLPDTFSPKEGKKIEIALKDDWSIFKVEEAQISCILNELFCKKKTIRYAYGSEKVLPLSQKMHLYVLE